MSTPQQSLSDCPHCGGAMDISGIPPFTRARCPHCGEETRVKTQMGKFELLRRLGIGGMSYVFAARDHHLERDVAVKILNEDYGTEPDRIAQFEREAKITASLSHPNIVRVFTVGEDLGRYFIAMELVEGDSLEIHIRRRGALPELEVLALAIEVVNGLAAAHSEGLIHRDIKPGNILIDAAGRPRIVDFGLALLTDEADGTQEIWATPYYVPPETLEGQDEDFRSDIYALGASLYHALAGRPPCPDDSVSLDRLKLAKREIEPLASAAPGLNPTTVEIIELAMAHAPEDRFEDYTMLLDALKMAHHSVSTGEAAPPIYGSQRSQRRSERDRRRKRLVAAVVSILGVALLAVTAVFVAEQFSGSRENDSQTARQPDEARTLDAPPEEDALKEAGLGIAAVYDDSRELLRNANFKDAAAELQKIIEDPEAPVSTVCWVTFEAAACYFQEGESGEARKLLEQLRRLLEQQGGRLDGTAETADVLARLLIQFPPVKPDDLARNPSGIEKLGYFVAALKNWEQGQFGTAQVLLRRFAKLPLTSATDTLGLYQQRADAYLRDAERLQRAKPEGEYNDIAAIKKQREILDVVYAELETRGRARRDVRAWNLRLAKRQRELRESREQEPDSEGNESFSDPWDKFDSLVSQWRFDEALKHLKTIKGTAEDRIDANYYLTETALSFQFNLVEILETEEPVLRDAGNEVLGKFAGLAEAPGRVKIQTEDGEEIEKAWSKLSVGQVDALFLAHARSLKSEFEREMRYEQLIAFNYLVGDRDRARQAAAKLDNEIFRTRWSQVMRALESDEQ